MEIKPIRSEADYQASLKKIEKLIESQPGSIEGDRMDVLVTLVEAYEAKHFPIPEPNNPVEVLEYYMESRGLSRSDLIAYLGSKERVSEVLNHKRGLSLEMIRRLHNGLGIPIDLIMGKNNYSTTHTHPARIAPVSQKGTKSHVSSNEGR
jgi:HTH-type transcriptional regulator/antitoxin HigA